MPVTPPTPIGCDLLTVQEVKMNKMCLLFSLREKSSILGQSCLSGMVTSMLASWGYQWMLRVSQPGLKEGVTPSYPLPNINTRTRKQQQNITKTLFEGSRPTQPMHTDYWLLGNTNSVSSTCYKHMLIKDGKKLKTLAGDSSSWSSPEQMLGFKSWFDIHP